MYEGNVNYNKCFQILCVFFDCIIVTCLQLIINTMFLSLSLFFFRLYPSIVHLSYQNIQSSCPFNVYIQKLQYNRKPTYVVHATDYVQLIKKINLCITRIRSFDTLRYCLSYTLRYV